MVAASLETGAVAGRARLFDPGVLLRAGAIAYVLVVCLLPLARLFAEAAGFAMAEGPASILDLLAGGAVGRALLNTLVAAIGGGIISLLLGAGAALLFGLTDLRGRAGLIFLFLLPLLIPSQIIVLAWLELFGPTGALRTALGLEGTGRNPLYGPGGVILLMGVEHAPIVFLAARAGLRAIPADLIEAARAAGQSPARAVLDIGLPLLRPALIAGGALAFVSAIGNFGVPALLGIPGRFTVLTTLVYQRLNAFGPNVISDVAVIAILLSLLAAAGLLVQNFARARGGLALEGAGRPLPPFALGRRRGIVTLAAWLLILPLSVLPLLALLATALAPALGVDLSIDTATLENFAFALTGSEAIRRAFANSLLLASGTAVVSILVAVPFAYFRLLRKAREYRLAEALIDAPYALPGIALSIAMILLYLPPLPGLGVSLYGGGAILFLAYLARFLAIGLRPVMAGQAQFDPRLDEAAAIAGAGLARRLRTIILPLSAPAAAAGALLIFMMAFNELTVSVLLWSSGWETLGVTVFTLQEEGNSTAAAAVAILSVLVTLAIAGLMTALGRHLPRGALPWQG